MAQIARRVLEGRDPVAVPRLFRQAQAPPERVCAGPGPGSDRGWAGQGITGIAYSAARILGCNPGSPMAHCALGAPRWQKTAPRSRFWKGSDGFPPSFEPVTGYASASGGTPLQFMGV